MAQKNDNAVLVTKSGLEMLKSELEELKTTRRHEVAQKIKEATEYGDLSENSEYDEAKNEQAFLEARILELEQMIKNAEIIDDSKTKGNSVGIGMTVVIASDREDGEQTYTIVGAVESDPLNGRISNESPVGKAILGKKKGDKVDVKTPSGSMAYTVIDVRH